MVTTMELYGGQHAANPSVRAVSAVGLQRGDYYEIAVGLLRD